jgi:hypothetical protein
MNGAYFQLHPETYQKSLTSTTSETPFEATTENAPGCHSAIVESGQSTPALQEHQ